MKIFVVLTLLFIAVSCSSGTSAVEDADTAVTQDTAVTPDADFKTPGNSVLKGTVALNEIDCWNRDWVEVFNLTQATIDVTGWTLSDDPLAAEHRYQLSSGSVLTAGGYLVVKEEKDAEAGFAFGLKCGEDTVYLLDTAGDIVDSVKLGSPAEGNTWGRLPDGSGVWQETGKTSEAANSAVSVTEPDLAKDFFSPYVMHSVAISLSGDSLTALAANPYTYVEGLVTITPANGEVSGPMKVGIRLKSGASFKPLPEKASFKINFDKYIEDNRFLGLKEINLNSMVDDPSMMHEAVAYKIFRDAGLTAVRTSYAQVTVNDEVYGIYAVLEAYDDVFTKRHFANTAHIYEGMADLFASETGNIEVDEGDETDRADLDTLIAAVNATVNETWLSSLAPLFNIEDFARLWAVENYIGQIDGYVTAANNYYLHSLKNGYFTMMPWGTDRAFTEHPAFPSCDRVVCKQCLADTTCAALYPEALAGVVEAADTVVSESVIVKIDTALEPYLAADTKRPYSDQEHGAAVEALRSFINERRNEAESRLIK